MSVILAVFVANTILATLAVVTQLYAVFRGVPELRPWHAATAILASIYVASYTVLFIAGTDNVATWSTWARAVSLLAWPIVWCAPAIMSVALLRRLHRVIDGAED